MGDGPPDVPERPPRPMGNDVLRQAIREAGLTTAEVAERLGVDVKTVERWIRPGRVPHPRSRQALAELLRREQDELWPPMSVPGLKVGPLAALEAQLAESRRRIEELERELVRYREALWYVTTVSARPVRVAEYVVDHEIGDTPDRDRTVESLLIESLDGRPLRWWLLTFGVSGERAPQKATLRELEGLHIRELLDQTTSRPLEPLYLGHRDGMIWALLLFDGRAGRVSIRVTWSWHGTWEMLRSACRDHAVLSLRRRAVDWGSVTVRFRFPAGAREPKARTDADTPPLLPAVSRDETGREVHTFRLDRPDRVRYGWDLQVQALSSHP